MVKVTMALRAVHHADAALAKQELALEAVSERKATKKLLHKLASKWMARWSAPNDHHHHSRRPDVHLWLVLCARTQQLVGTRSRCWRRRPRCRSPTSSACGRCGNGRAAAVPPLSGRDRPLAAARHAACARRAALDRWHQERHIACQVGRRPIPARCLLAQASPAPRLEAMRLVVGQGRRQQQRHYQKERQGRRTRPRQARPCVRVHGLVVDWPSAAVEKTPSSARRSQVAVLMTSVLLRRDDAAVSRSGASLWAVYDGRNGALVAEAIPRDRGQRHGSASRVRPHARHIVVDPSCWSGCWLILPMPTPPSSHARAIRRRQSRLNTPAPYIEPCRCSTKAASGSK